MRCALVGARKTGWLVAMHLTVSARKNNIRGEFPVKTILFLALSTKKINVVALAAHNNKNNNFSYKLEAMAATIPAPLTLPSSLKKVWNDRFGTIFPIYLFNKVFNLG